MKVISITGENYSGEWKKTRTACHCIITDGSGILLSYEVYGTDGTDLSLPAGLYPVRPFQ